MIEIKEAPDAVTSKGSKKSEECPITGHNYYITLVMAVTTALACWRITDVWSGVIALLCTMITIWMVYDYVGGLEDDSEKA